MAIASSLWSAPSSAVSISLGDQDFASGTILSGGIAQFIAAQTNEPSPIGLYFGGDTPQQATPGPFIASWTFNFAPGAVTSATISFGIFDHDTLAAGHQLTSFSVDGIDLTALLDPLMEAAGIGENGQVDVFALALSGAALAALQDGVATFSMQLDGPGRCFVSGVGNADCSPNVGNGAGLDFSTLTFNANVVPEPATLALVGIGLLAIAGLRRRSAQRRGA